MDKIRKLIPWLIVLTLSTLSMVAGLTAILIYAHASVWLIIGVALAVLDLGVILMTEFVRRAK